MSIVARVLGVSRSNLIERANKPARLYGVIFVNVIFQSFRLLVQP